MCVILMVRWVLVQENEMGWAMLIRLLARATDVRHYAGVASYSRWMSQARDGEAQDEEVDEVVALREELAKADGQLKDTREKVRRVLLKSCYSLLSIALTATLNRAGDTFVLFVLINQRK